jgi:hypothetical protein
MLQFGPGSAVFRLRSVMLSGKGHIKNVGHHSLNHPAQLGAGPIYQD